ncbi:MAG TPA: alpha/beta hydrolase [Gemmatimonadaceae bacterium]|nr:alpha/beta hydrolase [Gemmatimonadaceae bacterium]
MIPRVRETNAAFIRLILAAFLFLFSLLTVFPPISYFLWQASIAVAELGHWLAIVGIALLVPGWKTRLGKVSSVFALAATCLLLSPVMRGLNVGRNLSLQLHQAFGGTVPRALPGAPPRSQPISVLTLFRKPPSPGVSITTETYATYSAKPLQLDVYRSDKQLRPAPLVIAIHGGSWRSGNRAELSALNYYLAARGYVVASPSYRFAPEFPHPAASEDIDAAISFLKGNADKFGIDSTRIVLLGRSAGAELALIAAYTRNDPAIKGVVDFYGPTDQKWGWDNPADARVYNSAETLRAFLNGTPAAVPEAYRTSSPINFVRYGVAPTLMIHGTLDPLVSVRQSARLDSALRSAHTPRISSLDLASDSPNPNLFIELPWGTHGCDYVFKGPCGQISTYAIERFISRVTK